MLLKGGVSLIYIQPTIGVAVSNNYRTIVTFVHAIRHKGLNVDAYYT